MKILVIDVGGTNIKFKHTGDEEVRKQPSGPTLTPELLVAAVHQTTADWDFDHVTIGFPSPVIHNKILREPVNLGSGWVGFDFSVLKKPFKLINDAAMQALGSYEGGRMLFLGLGTGLGNTLILDGNVAPLEIGHLPYRKGRSYEQYVGEAALKRVGKRKWQGYVFDVVERFKKAFVVDYVVLGGGNVRKLDELPPGARRGDNNNAFLGGVRLWEDPKISN
jgi:predicted NBD/HSP70 family sugar kinase